MTAVLMDPVIRTWKCPSCELIEQTGAVDNRMHACPALGDFVVPLVIVEHPDDRPDARHLMIDREDYLGDSNTGRIMACNTERGDGSNDRTVYAPTAELNSSSPMARGGINASAQMAAVAAEMLGHQWQDPELQRMADMARENDVQMAWSASAVFARTIYSQIRGGHAFNWLTDSLLVALYNNSGTPDQTVTTDVLTEYNGAASQWVTANEVSQAVQWPAGGVALATVAITQTTNVVKFTGANTASGSAATLANVYGCLVYDSTISNIGFCYNYFGGANSVTGGTFTVVWNAGGIATFTC